MAVGSVTVVIASVSEAPVRAAVGVSAPASLTLNPNTADQNPDDFVISGYGATDELLVSIGFVNPPAGTTFRLPTLSGLVAGFGYGPVFSSTNQHTQISFRGTMSNANAALRDMLVSTGSATGDVTVRVSSSIYRPNIYFNPINGHYYEYVARATTYANSANTSESALHLADQRTLYGVRGYLATITSAQEQKFILSNVDATNIWVGGSDDFEVLNSVLGAGTFANQAAAEGKWHWITGPEAGTKFWEGATDGKWVSSTNTLLDRTSGNAANARYENWCAGNPGPDYTLVAGRGYGEPNNAGSEQYILEKWGGAACWNDYGTKGGNPQSGYLVEYSENWGSGANARGTFSTTDVASAQATAVVNYAATNVVAEPGNGQAKITWSAPAGGTVQSYAVTTTPAGGTCTPSPVTARECLVRGLADGTSYTFTVTTTFQGGATVASNPSATWTSTNSRPTITGPSTLTASNNQPSTVGTFTIADPNSCGWTSVTATATTSAGTLAATAAGGASVTGSGTATVKVTGPRSAVATVLSAMTLSAASGSNPTITTSVVPAITFTNPGDGRTYHFNPSNGHYYWIDLASQTVATARSARTLASTNKFCGSYGYLASIVDATEQAFIEAEALGTAGNSTSLWTSGFRDGATCAGNSCSGGTWKWSPGPFAPIGEDGLALYDTDGGGPWQPGEPNNSGPQHHLWFNNNRYGWDDVGGTSSQGVLVEFGSITSFSPSSVSTSVTVVAAPPSAPSITSTTATQTTLTVNFTAPTDNGGSAITNYSYSTDNGTTWTALNPASTTSPIVISGLTDSTTYQVKIRANNGLDGTASTAVSASTRPPQGVVTAPTLSDISTTTFTDVFAGSPLTNFTGTIRAAITATNATVKLSTVTGLSTVVGYSQDWTDGSATEIAFSGTVAQVNAALDSLSVRGNSAGNASLDVTVSSGGAAFDPGTGHYYEFVSTAVSWGEARCLAKYTDGAFDGTTNGTGVNGDDCTDTDGGGLTRRTYDGMTGYLASVTTAAENTFVLSKVGNSAAWLGGTDLAVEGTWKWVDGPENGQNFWLQGTSSTRCGTNQVGGFARYNCWNGGEPNDAGGEDALQMLVGGSGEWNDLPSETYSLFYIIEYGLDGETASGQAAVNVPLFVKNHREPRQVEVTPGDRTALVSFVAPIDAANGDPITGYTVTASPGGATCVASITDMFCSVPGLTNGTPYTFTVVADSTTFTAGRASTPTVAVTPGVPFNQVPPSITGTIRVGSTLTAVDPNGNWVNPRGDAMTATYQWKADGQDISGAIGPTLLITANLAGKVITVVTTRTNDIGTGSAVSGAIAVVPSVYLTDLQTSVGTLSPIFSPSTLTYTLAARPGAQSIDLTATASNGTIVVAGAPAASGVATTVPLDTGVNVIEISVSRNFVTLTYEITITVPVLIVFIPPTAERPAPDVSAPLLAPRPVDPDNPIPQAPVVTVTGELPSVPLGDGFLTVGGVPAEMTIDRVETGRWEITGPDFTMELEIVSPNIANVDAQGNIFLIREEIVRVEGDGFQPGSLVDVWLFSTPQFVGTVQVDAAGNVLGDLRVPGGIEPGTHTLQVNGQAVDNQLRSLNMGVRVADRSMQLPVTGRDSSVPMVVAWWLLAAGLFAVGARRQWSM